MQESKEWMCRLCNGKDSWGEDVEGFSGALVRLGDKEDTRLAGSGNIREWAEGPGRRSEFTGGGLGREISELSGPRMWLRRGDVARCKREGCETKWYHVDCIEPEIASDFVGLFTTRRVFHRVKPIFLPTQPVTRKITRFGHHVDHGSYVERSNQERGAWIPWNRAGLGCALRLLCAPTLLLLFDMDQPTDYLDRVPVEVWAACWVLCTAPPVTPNLPGLPLVSIYLLAVAPPAPDFRSRVTGLRDQPGQLDGPCLPPAPDSRSTGQTISRSLDSFGPVLGGYLRTHPLDDALPPQIRHIGLFDAIQNRVHRTFCTTLNLYRNLETLYIVGLLFDPAMWNTLLALPKLEVLQLCNSFVARDAGSGTTADGTQQVLMLRSIGLGHSSLLLDGLRRGGSITLLTYPLDLWTMSSHFFGFSNGVLDSNPSQSCHSNHRLSSRSPPLVLPHLRSLNGPARLIRLLAPDRPVSRAVIVNQVMVADERLKMDELMLTCSDLSCSSVPIHSLALPRTSPTFEFLNRIVHMFPHVRELSLGIESFHMPSFMVHPRFAPPEVEGDMELPEFRHAEAFDNLPKEELSDDESDDHPPIVVVSKESSFSTDNPVEVSTWRRMGTLWKSDGKPPVRILPDTHGEAPKFVLSGTQEMASSQFA
ncbi:hypothetical protein B0H14DRAFT_3149409 [Mycena olivaceomarginata]|nr:hypothetical protein B0H14DRAFT_3149409 [Mycena olivaceomarginata]